MTANAAKRDEANEPGRREIVSLKHAAKTAGVDQRTLRKRMAEKEIPMIELGTRKRGILLGHFDELIASLSKSAKPNITTNDFAWLDQLALTCGNEIGRKSCSC